ncbi:MAG: penicillin-binding transpeptidase domain-containing protein [Nannocystaceae bacterium]
MESSNRRLSGVGALFFLASLGAIALYAQNQVVPEEHDAIRTSATIVPEAVETIKATTLPWRDRLDLASMKPTALPVAPGEAAKENGPGKGNAEAAAPTDAPPDLDKSLYVQDLGDGNQIRFTLDPVLQDSALQIFRNREVPYAAAVILDVEDNAVLAMAGHSTMDPQVDPLEVLTTAWAPAASTFKVVTAASLLAHKRANARTKACFSGGLQGITDEMLTDNNERDTRCATLSAAVAHSHNLVIAKLALKHLGKGDLQETARDLGFEREMPFEFPVEISPAHIPSDARERAKVAAGFWHVDMSPIHGAVLASTIARGGIFQPPHLVAEVRNTDGSDLTPPLPKAERVLTKTAAREVGKMMVGTTKEGTARKSFRDRAGIEFISGVDVAGKTGSLTGKRPPALNYNWFIGFAPAENPEIAFAVLIANEPKWRIKAHYAARRLIQIYLKRRSAIADHKRVRLGDEGLVYPGVAEATKVADATPAPADTPEKVPDSPTPAEPAPESDTPELPPVPGPLPKPPAG